MQRLHGMGEGVYREVLRDAAVAVRVYAPVGEHRDLLAYLVRRLLENGANSSFVHQLADEAVERRRAARVAAARRRRRRRCRCRLALYGSAAAPTPPASTWPAWPSASRCSTARWPPPRVAPVARSDERRRGTPRWRACTPASTPGTTRPLAERAAVLRRAADALEARLPEFCGLLVKEAHKTWATAWPRCARRSTSAATTPTRPKRAWPTQVLPGPTGESNELRLHGRGVFVCISPWNFPLAIFAGQVVAALVAGNAVAAKPAEQTPAVAQRFVALLHEAGVPADALALLHGPGETVGAALVADPRTAGVCFTGSTAGGASIINRTLAAKDGPIVPLIAETGGINAMIVDSTALPEQVVDAVVQSAFRSAGQRCSALRLLCVHEGVADGVIEMIRGALAELRVGDPALLATDVGPVIDAEAFDGIGAHVTRLRGAGPADRRDAGARRTCPRADRAGGLRARRASPTCSRRSSARCCTWCAGAATSDARDRRRSTRSATA